MKVFQMISRSLILAVLTLALTLAPFLYGCGEEATTGGIAMKIVWQSGSGAAQAASFKPQALPAGVVSLRITVSADGMKDLVVTFTDLEPTGGKIRIEGVEPGANRKVVVEALDANGTVTYRGEISGITVEKGKYTNAGTVILYDILTPCTAECTDGSQECFGSGYRVCGNYDIDICLDWGQEQACGSGETCSNGVCSTTCADECTAGDKTCSGDGYRVCGNYDADACTDWGPITACGSGETCSAGTCSATCADECTSGAQECSGTGYRVCGSFDSDACTDWGPVVSCTGTETCSNGYCSSTCLDDCSMGDTECSGMGTKACGQFDADSCLDWGLVTPCGTEEACVTGACELLPPPAPSGLTATKVSLLRIDLAWTDNAVREDGFKIERKAGASGTYAQIGMVVANVAAYQDTALVCETTYYYQMRGYNNGGNSAYTSEANATTGLCAPSGLQAAAASASQIDLSWTDNSNSETGYKIERKTGAGGTYAEVGTVGASVAVFHDTGVTCENTYYYRVRASNAVENSDYSAEVNAATPLCTPTGLGAVKVSATRIDLSWTDNSSNETGYKIERKTGTGGTYAEIGTVGAGVVSYQDTGATCENTYYYRVRASNAGGSSAYSAEANATVALCIPSGLKVTAFTSTQIGLSWTDNSGIEDGYKIERKTGSGGTYAQVGTVGAGVTVFSNTTGLTCETSYYYQVRAYKGTDYSEYSSEVTALTRQCVPTSLQATAITPTRIDLSWTDNSTGETGFKIERKTGSGGTYAEIGTVGAGLTAYSNSTGLTCDTAYYYRIRATGAGGDSDYSNETNATTGLCAPSNPQASRYSSMQINLSWTDNNNNETGYRIERKIEGGAYGVIQTIGPNVVSFPDTGLIPSTIYRYRFQALDSINSDYSTEVTAKTKDRSWGTPQLVEVGLTNNNSAYPNIVVDGSGNAMVAWVRPDGLGGSDIWANRYDHNTRLWGTPVAIENESNKMYWYPPAITINVSGNVFAAWNVCGDSGCTYTHVLSNRYISNTWTPEYLESSNDNAGDPVVVADRSGNAWALWSQYNTGDGSYHIYSAKYIAGGGWYYPYEVDKNGVGPKYQAETFYGVLSVAINNMNEVVAVYLKNSDGNDKIWTNKYVPGLGWRTPQIIEDVNYNAYNPVVKTYGSGNTIAVWIKASGPSAPLHIYSSVYKPGIGWGTATKIEDDEIMSVVNLRLAVDGFGNAIAVWTRTSAEYHICANRYTDDSGWDSSQVQLDVGTTSAQFPNVSFDYQRNAMVTWTQRYSDEVNDLCSKRYVAGVGWETVKYIENNNYYQGQQEVPVVFDPFGNAIVVWAQEDDTTRFIYSNRWE